MSATPRRRQPAGRQTVELRSPRRRSGLLVLLGMLASGGVVGVRRARRSWLRAHLRSPAVRHWRRSSHSYVRTGRVVTRVSAASEATHTVLLLHGLATASDYWSAHYEESAPDARIVAPDLLGFGRSLDRSLTSEQCSLAAHTAAVVHCLKQTAADGSPLVIVAHSMSCLLALSVAEEMEGRVASVVLFAPTFHENEREFIRHIESRGRYGRWLATDRVSAHLVCSSVCRHTRISQPLFRLIASGLPSPVARQTSLHSWNSYVGTLRAFASDRAWRARLNALTGKGIPVTIAVGERDHTIDRDVIRALASEPGIDLITRPRTGHQLPISDPGWAAELVAAKSPGHQRQLRA